MERQQKKRVLVWLLRVFVILQLLFIVYVNFSKAYGLLDYDFALSFRHGMEIWKNGLFLKDFVYYSSLETDTVTFFASLLYLLTGNFSAALAAAHLAGYAAITLLLWDISRNLEASEEQFLLIVLMLFTPYSVGQLNWANMLFIAGGQYGFRVMTLLFFLDLLLMSSREAVPGRKWIVLTVLFGVLTFWTALSAGNFVLCMIIFPLMCWQALEVWREGSIILRSRRNAVLAAAVFCSLGGWLLRQQFIGPTHRSSLSLVPVRQWFDNAFRAVEGLFLLFGAVPDGEGISVFSAEGIAFLIHFLFLFCCGVLIWREWREKGRKSPIVMAASVFSFVYIGVLLLADTTYSAPVYEFRYHIPWCVLIVLAAGYAVMKRWMPEAGWVRNAPVYGFLMLLAGVNLWEGYWLATRSPQINQVTEMEEAVSQLDVAQVYLYQKDEYAAMLRVTDLERRYMNVLYGENGMEASTGDFYGYAGDRYGADDENVLICNTEDFDTLPAYIRSRYEKTGPAVYYGTENPWDGMSGLPLKSVEQAVDFPYSSGYLYTGEIADNGVLVGLEADGGDYMLRGPYTEPVPGRYRITVYYSIFQEGSQPSRLETVLNEETVLGETELLAGQNAVSMTVDVPAGEKIEFRIWKPGDGITAVEKFEFERLTADEI